MSADQLRIKARRIRGAAIITVIRGERIRRYRVSMLRLARLRWLLVFWPGAHGWMGRGGVFDMGLTTPQGYAQALSGARRSRVAKVRALFPTPANVSPCVGRHCPGREAGDSFGDRYVH